MQYKVKMLFRLWRKCFRTPPSTTVESRPERKPVFCRFVKQFEKVLIYIEKLFSWDKPFQSFVFILIVNTVFWFFLTSNHRFYFFVFTFLLLWFLYITWKGHYNADYQDLQKYDTSQISDKIQFQFSNSVYQLWSTICFFLKVFSSLHHGCPGLFCLIGSTFFMAVAIVGSLAPGSTLAYGFFLFLVLWPGFHQLCILKVRKILSAFIFSEDHELEEFSSKLDFEKRNYFDVDDQINKLIESRDSVFSEDHDLEEFSSKLNFQIDDHQGKNLFESQNSAFAISDDQELDEFSLKFDFEKQAGLDLDNQKLKVKESSLQVEALACEDLNNKTSQSGPIDFVSTYFQESDSDSEEFSHGLGSKELHDSDLVDFEIVNPKEFESLDDSQ